MKLPFETFNDNEWFILVGIICLYGVVFLLPRRLDPKITLILFVWGFTVSKFFDFTIGGGLFDYYEVNDSAHYEIFDEMSYFVYAPFSYFFIYFFDALRIKGKFIGMYILSWSIIAVGSEWLTVIFHMITYKKGYTMMMSFPIYLFTQSMTLIFYRWITRGRQE